MKLDNLLYLLIGLLLGLLLGVLLTIISVNDDYGRFLQQQAEFHRFITTYYH